MSLAVGYSYYNDLKSMKRGIPTFIDEVDYIKLTDEYQGKLIEYEKPYR